MKIIYSPKAKNQIQHLPPEVKKGIKSTLEQLAKTPFLGKNLQRELTGHVAFRYKRYRIIYKIDNLADIIRIYWVDHRSQVYESFKKTLIGH